MTDTRTKLVDAAAATLRDDGIAALSARAIATRAGVNQALVFYHFKTVAELVDAACRRAIDAGIAEYRSMIAAAATFSELLQAGRDIHARERERGNVALFAQLMAAAAHDDVLATTARYALDLWITELEAAVTRLLDGSPLTEITDTAGLTRAVVTAFLGLTLYEGVDPDSATAALDSFQHLGALVEVMDDLGPVGRRELRGKVRRRSRPATGRGRRSS